MGLLAIQEKLSGIYKSLCSLALKIKSLESGSASYPIQTSSAGTLPITNAANIWTFTGTTTTWTLPAVVSNEGLEIVLINQGSGNITLNSASANEIYDSGVISSTMPILPTENYTLVNNGTHWIVKD